MFVGFSIAAVAGSLLIITLPANLAALFAAHRALVLQRLPARDAFFQYFHTSKTVFFRSILVIWPLSMALLLSWLDVQLMRNQLPLAVLRIDQTTFLLLDCVLALLTLMVLTHLSFSPSSIRTAVKNSFEELRVAPLKAALFLVVVAAALTLCVILPYLYLVMLGGLVITSANHLLAPSTS